MRKKIGVGIIGAGMYGLEHVKAFVNCQKTEVRWLVGGTRRRPLDDAKSKYPIANVGFDANAMYADKEVDLIVIATPPWTHFQLGLDAIRSGKDVLIEKPLCISSKDAEKLLAAARKNPNQLVFGASSRHSRINPKFTSVKKMIDEGKLGKIYYIHHRAVSRQSRPGIEYNPPAKWFLDRKKAGGGIFYDWGPYDLAFHLGLVGDPAFEGCSSFMVNGLDSVEPGTEIFDVEEHGAALMRFEGGLRYYWERASNAHSDFPNQTTIYGTKGGMRLSYCTWDAQDIEVFTVDNDGRGKPRREVITVDMSNHPGDMGVFIDRLVKAVSSRGQLPVTLEHEVANIRTIEKVYSASDWLATRKYEQGHCEAEARC